MTDVVERLQKYPDRMITDPDGLMIEAADEIELNRDIIEALRHQVMIQNEEINKYRVWIRKLGITPHDWLRKEIKDILGEQ